MFTEGIPVRGLNTIGRIVETNTLQFREHQGGLAIAVAVLSTHTANAPVVDGCGRYGRFINEFNVMRALAAGEELGQLVAKDIMHKDQLAVTSATLIGEAAAKMEEHRVFSLPVAA